MTGEDDVFHASEDDGGDVNAACWFSVLLW